MQDIKRRVILCAGHGGGDPGSVGQGTTEAAEVIDIVNRTVDYLRNDGQIEVVHVPNELGFEAGIAWVNTRYKHIDDALAVEVHKNATVNARGAEVWYVNDPISRDIAQTLQNQLRQVLQDRGIKDDTRNRFGRLGWCREVNTWAPLVEVGFVSDGGDPVGAAANDRYAKALALGILNVFGLNFKVATPPPAQPAPPTVTWTYKVISTAADGKQLGVYNERKNAWAKYIEFSGAAKILDKNGVDQTAAFSVEFNPPTPPEEQPPATQNPGHPVEIDEILNTVKSNNAILQWIKDLLSRIFK